MWTQDDVLGARVYPRPRGVTIDDPMGMITRAGLSPPTRGNRAVCGTFVTDMRSIPAHAG